MNPFRTLMVAALCAVTLAACDWVGGDDDHEHDVHVRAYGLELVMDGHTIVSYRDGVVTGTIQAPPGGETDRIALHFLDEEGARIPSGNLSDDHHVQWTVAAPSIAALGQAERDRWGFYVRGLAAGNTAVELQLYHADHVDFRSMPIPIEVAE